MKKNKIFYGIFILIVGIYLLFKGAEREPYKNFEDMRNAKKNVQILFEDIKNEKLKRGIPIDKNLDINNTGIIGEEFTGITTTLGDLDSKRLSTNSNFAAYFVKVFKDAKLKKGDLIIVNMSSSFPGLNLSLISALDTLSLKGVIINSIGSSMYGANNEEFTFLEMAKFLERNKKINNTISAYSLGGDWDIGNNFDAEVKNKIEKRIEIYNLKNFSERDIEKNLKSRKNFYNSFGEAKYFVNIGGNIMSSRLGKNYKNKGIPTLNMLNIKKFGTQLGLSIKERKDEIPKEIFGKKNYMKDILIVVVFILGILMIKNSHTE